MRITSCIAAWAIVGAASISVHGQALTRRDMSLQIARTIADASMAACQKTGTNVTAAVVDRAGQIVLIHRHDAANPHNAELARRKAYTARTFGVPTLQFRDNSAGTSEFAGQRQLTDIIALGGGVPIRVGNDLIGAVGLSGSPNQADDERCALEGIKAASGLLK